MRTGLYMQVINITMKHIIIIVTAVRIIQIHNVLHQ